MTSLCLSLLAKFSLCHSKVISLQLKNINFLKRKNSLFGFDFWHLIFIWICLSYPAWSLLSFVSFIRFEFSPIISSDSLPAPFSLFSPSKTPIVCMFTCWMIFLRFHSLCPLQFFSFVFLWSIIDIVLSSHWLHPLKCVFESLWWCFISVIVFFSSERKRFWFPFRLS